MSPTYLISIVVCTFNRSRLLQICLESLVTQTADKSLFEIIVVNNNSSDDTQETVNKFADKFPNIKIVVEKKQGLSHARNKGWQEAEGEYIAFIDDDAKASPQWCEHILYAIRTVIPVPVALGGPILAWYDYKPPSWFYGSFEIRTHGNKEMFLEGPCFFGGNMVIKKQAFIQHGGFSDEFGMKGKQLRMGEENELLTKIYKSEPSFWYDPKMSVEHYTPREKTRVTYRVFRQWHCGIAAGKIERQKYSLPIFFAKIIILPFQIIRRALMPWFSCKQKLRPSLVKALEHFGFMGGKFLTFYRNK